VPVRGAVVLVELGRFRDEPAAYRDDVLVAGDEVNARGGEGPPGVGRPCGGRVISSLPARGPDPAAISIPSAASSASASRAVRSARIAEGTGWSAVITVLTEPRLGSSTRG
jgi:hypothetical protein